MLRQRIGIFPNKKFTLLVESNSKKKGAFMYSALGSWRVENGMLIMTILDSDNALAAPIGLVSKHKIIAVEEGRMVLQQEKGRPSTWIRE